MPRSSYTLTINVPNATTLDILKSAPYTLRVGKPPKDEAEKLFESKDNVIPFEFVGGHESDEKWFPKTIVTLTFTAEGWVYSISYKSLGETALHDEQDIVPGQVYVVPKTGAVEKPRPKIDNDGFMRNDVFGVINATPVALALRRRPKDPAASSSTLVAQYPTWFPGFGIIKPPADGDSSAPKEIYVWFETQITSTGAQKEVEAQHEVTGVKVTLGETPELALYVRSDGTIAAEQERTEDGITPIAIPLNKQSGSS
ncbi:uncharacterized protein Z520_01443 [Fonsecaea multimorphosa CBS 102226]|uniref:Uncharacterized protein n=1 Tax=Fonsecaea multimorphosa CBS 102226 TaxID=1442371 RepID=A0A0D2KAD2_9EURO|nr:uncharacterized protein Z520_01443 [Fonsecaea multimorphosa CBS 102226]KIY02978.1 hypothetical protein Z520_01443 [Fonsecaea multimorphosa CBS 102226]OAL30808.1 hypothetical protein AYO22_01428 [Fonsecaea multimorphosa]